MKFSLILSALSTAALVSADCIYCNQTANFNLIVRSSNASIDGRSLYACHEGAAIEGLCLGGPPAPGTASQSFTFNTSSYPTNYDPAVGEPGFLTYLLIGANFQLSEPLELSYDPTTNYAVPLFTPSLSGTQVAFDENSKLNIQGYDTAANTNVAYYRWYICTTRVGYVFTTLAWTLGAGEPENPTCQKVDVVREF